MMDEYTSNLIKNEADRLRKEIKNGVLFGYPMDMDNPDMVLFAVWSKGVHEEQLKSAKSIETISEIMGVRK